MVDVYGYIPVEVFENVAVTGLMSSDLINIPRMMLMQWSMSYFVLIHLLSQKNHHYFHRLLQKKT